MKFKQHRRGVATIWFAVVGLALAGLFALALDSARYYYSFEQLQAAADSSALAALDYLPTDNSANLSTSQNHAISVAADNLCAGQGVTLLRNDSNSASGDIVFGRYNFVTKNFSPTDRKSTRLNSSH